MVNTASGLSLELSKKRQKSAISKSCEQRKRISAHFAPSRNRLQEFSVE